MLEKIKEVAEHLRSNIEHRGPLAELLEAIGREHAELKARVAELEAKLAGQAAPVAPVAPAAPVLTPPFSAPQ